MADHDTGSVMSAQRRRERRLRSRLKHERQSVAMLLAEAHHLSCDRSRQGGGGGPRDVRRLTETEDSPSGGAAGHPRGAQAAEE